MALLGVAGLGQRVALGVTAVGTHQQDSGWGCGWDLVSHFSEERGVPCPNLPTLEMLWSSTLGARVFFGGAQVSHGKRPILMPGRGHAGWVP